jgi:hypothetical protein
MDQERADYTDYESVRRERPQRTWTLLQIVILVIAIGVAIPVVGILILGGLMLLTWEGR